MFNILAIPAVISLGSLNIALLDLFALIILIVALIVGYAKGFINQVLAIFGLFASLILGYLFCDNVSNFIVEKIPSVAEKMRGFINNLIGIDLTLANSEEALITALEQSKIPAFLHKSLASIVVNSNFEVKLLDTLTNWSLNIISFISIVIISTILFKVIKFFANKFVSLPVLNTVNRVLGLALSGIKAIIIISVVLLVASMFLPLNSYLQPEGVTCHLNSVLQFIANSNLIKNLFV